ncbi:MAG TPA: hypothetical protein VGI86_09595, partial [Acidimicrobiia bacterium]
AQALADVAAWAGRLHRRVSANGCLPDPTELHRDVAGAIAAHLGVDDGLHRVVLCASGTDAECVVGGIVLAGTDRPVRNIVLGSMEAGSGTRSAAAGRYFGAATPFRVPVTAGEPIEGFDADRVRLVDVELRDARGRARRPFDVEAEVEAHIEDAIDCGETVLVHVMAGSKTDLRYLSADWVRVWRSRGGAQFRCVVDAAQWRMSGAELREYLAAGAAIIVTGSKAIGAPPFCGALILDDALLTDAHTAMGRGRSLPSGLRDFMARADLPSELQALLPNAEPANLGLLARWHVAVEEIHRFAAVPDLWREAFVHALRGLVVRGLQTVPEMVVADTGSPTIVSFGLRAGDGGLAAKLVLRDFYDAVLSTPGVHIGQPVELPSGGAFVRYAIGHVTVTRAANSSESAAGAAAAAAEAAVSALRTARAGFVLT